MNKSEAIDQLVRSTFKRAMRESVVGIILIGILAYKMQTIVPGSSQFYGTIITIASLGFIIGVLWSYVIGYHTLRVHPENDSVFWRETFLAQARLFRLVPLWYLAPILTGVMISVLPSQSNSYEEFVFMLVVCILIFASLTWLNRRGAQKLEKQAQSFI